MRHVLFVLSAGEVAEYATTFSLEDLRAYREAVWRQRDESDDPVAQLFYDALACDLTAAVIERLAREGGDLLRRLGQPPEK